MSAVINEAMRIHPATGCILERQVPEGGVTLHGVHLPKGTVVGVNAWVLTTRRTSLVMMRMSSDLRGGSRATKGISRI